MLDVFEICAGGGGQALGLERAGFQPLGLVENDRHACATLEFNRPGWPVIENDVQKITHSDLPEVDLLAGGVPCPPFSVSGRQLGSRDSRDLFPVALRLAESMGPKAVLLENVPGFAANRFREYRRNLFLRLNRIGYAVSWKVLNACDFGVPQLRPRFILVSVR